MKRLFWRFILRHFRRSVECRSAGDPNAIWKRRERSEWIRDRSTTCFVSHLLGLRSDYVHFYVTSGLVAVEDLTPETRETIEENMRLSLDRFLHCRCRVSRSCLLHYIESL